VTEDHSQPAEKSKNGETIAVAFGRQLSAARELAGESTATIAQQLCITSGVVALLESGHWESAGPDVYVRGYLITYCRLVDLDAAEVILYFQQRESERVASDSLKAVSRQRRPEFAQYQRVAGYLAATLLIGPALIFWVSQGFRGGDPQISAKPQEQLAQTAVPASQELHDQQSRTSQFAVEDPVMASMATVPETRPRTTGIDHEPGLLPGQDAGSVTEPVSSSHQGIGLLELNFQEDVWLEVSDGSGKRLDYGLMSASSERSFPIARGLSVRLGNAQSVVARVDGKVLDLGPYINQEVANFTLPVANPDNDD
jgi:cytoskeleton protein RodZ